MNINNSANQLNAMFNSSSSISPEELKLLLSNRNVNLTGGLEELFKGTNNQFIQGKILSVSGGEILLSVGNNQTLQASCQSGISPSVGQVMTFAFSGVSSGKITLTPLFENTAQGSMAKNALLAANLPDTPENEFMVKCMMEEGLPIGKEHLLQMAGNMKSMGAVDPHTICQMMRLNIPITENNVSVFETYKNYNSSISDTFSDVTQSLADTIKSAADLKDIAMVLSSADILVRNDGMEESVGNLLDKFINLVNKEGLLENELQLQENGALPKEDGKLPDSESTSKSEIYSESDSDKVQISDANIRLSSSTDLNLLTKNLKDLGFDEHFVENVRNNKISSQEFVASVISKLKSGVTESGENETQIPFDKEALSKLFDNPIFKTALKDTAANKYSLHPEEVAQDDKVSKAFDKLANDMKEISQEISSLGKNQTPVFEAVNNVNSNLEFMNQLNQTFNYVQIPLKMMNQNATGELYVYSNKKSLAKDDKNVSALLHLDMDNLGPLDVHVLMNENNHVQTKFFLKDDAALDIIAQNIHILNERLNNRGYSVNCEFVKKDEDKKIIDSILDDSKNISLISSGSFDARA